MAASEAAAGTTERRERRLIACLSGVAAVLTAGVVTVALSEMAQGAWWSRLVAWLLAGVVAGLIVRRHASAVKVAVVTTLSAAVVTGLLAFTQQDPGPRSELARPLETAAPTAGEMLLATVACGLACVLGAAGVIELQRQLERHRRRGRVY